MPIHADELLVRLHSWVKVSNSKMTLLNFLCGQCELGFLLVEQGSRGLFQSILAFQKAVVGSLKAHLFVAEREVGFFEAKHFSLRIKSVFHQARHVMLNIRLI